VVVAAMTRGVESYAAIGAAALMIALIGAISLTGEWPTSGWLIHPAAQGILDIPSGQVTRVEVGAAEHDVTGFEHRASGGWRVNGEDVEPAIAQHIDNALRMLKVSKPTRTLKPDEYNATDVATFGLDPARMVVRVFASDSKDAVAFGEATPAQNAQYVRVIGRPNVYLLPYYVGVEWQVALDMFERATPSEVLTGKATPRALLLPVSMAAIWAVEIVEAGVLTRFERDPAGDWFHHFGQHTHGPGGLVHKADPKLAPVIAAELGAVEHIPVESVLARQPKQDLLAQYGLEHPSSIMVLYTRDSLDPVARVAFGDTSLDGLERYARVQETDAVVVVSKRDADHVTKLVQLARGSS
jgi:hypothetical protein